MNSGSSYEERRRDVEEEASGQPAQNPVKEEKTTSEPILQTEENSPMPEPQPVPEPDSEPIPIPVPVFNQNTAEPEKEPQWVKTLMDQQEKILSAIGRLEAQKQSSILPRPGASSAALTQLERQTRELTESVGKMERSTAELIKSNAEMNAKNVEVLRDSKNFQADSRVRMQRELDGYQKLFSDEVFAPILMEMGQIYITCWKYISQQKDEKIRDDLQSILLESMEEFFEDHDVEIRQTAVNQERSLRRCKTRRTVPTGDESLHGMVAQSLNPSFCIGKKVLIKEVVDTFVFDSALKEAPAEEIETAPVPENQELPEREMTQTTESPEDTTINTTEE